MLAQTCALFRKSSQSKALEENNYVYTCIMYTQKNSFINNLALILSAKATISPVFVSMYVMSDFTHRTI
jgi:hypothetical protein